MPAVREWAVFERPSPRGPHFVRSGKKKLRCGNHEREGEVSQRAGSPSVSPRGSYPEGSDPGRRGTSVDRGGGGGGGGLLERLMAWDKETRERHHE